MLNGASTNSLDDKSRLIIPAKIRESLGGQFVLTRGLDRCLTAYTTEAWKKLEEKQEALDMFDPLAREFERHFFGHAELCTVDKMNRVVLPKGLRDFAKIDKDIYIFATGNKVEIWDKQLYEEQHKEEPDDIDISSKFSALGFGAKG